MGQGAAACGGAAFILAMQLGSFLAIGLLQRSHPGHAGFDPRDLVYVPASLLGTLLGMALYGRLNDKLLSCVEN